MEPIVLTKFVPEKTLSKAIIYQRDGMVQSWDNTGGNFRATVQGAEVYHVNGRIERSRLLEWHCTCQASGKGVCKHVAAALIHGARMNKSPNQHTSPVIQQYKQMERTSTSPSNPRHTTMGNSSRSPPVPQSRSPVPIAMTGKQSGPVLQDEPRAFKHREEPIIRDEVRRAFPHVQMEQIQYQPEKPTRNPALNDGLHSPRRRLTFEEPGQKEAKRMYVVDEEDNQDNAKATSKRTRYYLPDEAEEQPQPRIISRGGIYHPQDYEENIVRGTSNAPRAETVNPRYPKKVQPESPVMEQKQEVATKRISPTHYTHAVSPPKRHLQDIINESDSVLEIFWERMKKSTPKGNPIFSAHVETQEADANVEVFFEPFRTARNRTLPSADKEKDKQREREREREREVEIEREKERERDFQAHRASSNRQQYHQQQQQQMGERFMYTADSTKGTMAAYEDTAALANARRHKWFDPEDVVVRKEPLSSTRRYINAPDTTTRRPVYIAEPQYGYDYE